MLSRGERAKQLFSEGYNCCQAVVGAFADCVDMEFDALMKLASSMGGGMGRLREVCGAVTGVFLVAGLLRGYSDPKATTEKAEHYRFIQSLAEAFREENGSIICRELLGEQTGGITHVPEKRTNAYYQKRPCGELCRDAADILEKALQQ